MLLLYKIYGIVVSRLRKKGIKCWLIISLMVSVFRVIYDIIVYVSEFPASFMLWFHNAKALGAKSGTESTLSFPHCFFLSRYQPTVDSTVVCEVDQETHLSSSGSEGMSSYCVRVVCSTGVFNPDQFLPAVWV